MLPLEQDIRLRCVDMAFRHFKDMLDKHELFELAEYMTGYALYGLPPSKAHTDDTKKAA